MHIKKQKKLTYRVGATAILASMIFLAEATYGTQHVQAILTSHYESLMKKREETYIEEKQSLVQELNLQKEQKKLTEIELKAVVGGAGDTPIVEEINKLRVSIGGNADTLENAVASLNENLTDVLGNDLVSKLVVLKETLKDTQERKKSSEQKSLKAKRLIEEIKRTAGGSGTGTPIIPRLQKFRNNSETVKSLEKVLAVSGDQVVDEVMVLKGTLAATQEEKENLTQQYVETQCQIVELKTEIGEEGGDTPTLMRVRTLSNSLKKDTVNLKEAVNTLTEKLHNVSGEDCVDKVESLVTDLAQAQMFLNVLAQKLDGIPGDGLVKKLEVLMAERETTKEILGDMRETIDDKEEAYNNLHIELLRVKTQADYLDEELSKEQVAHSERREQLNHVLGRQFNHAFTTPVNTTKTPETNETT